MVRQPTQLDVEAGVKPDTSDQATTTIPVSNKSQTEVESVDSADIHKLGTRISMSGCQLIQRNGRDYAKRKHDANGRPHGQAQINWQTSGEPEANGHDEGQHDGISSHTAVMQVCTCPQISPALRCTDCAFSVCNMSVVSLSA